MKLLQNNFLGRISILMGNFSTLKKVILSGGLFLLFFFITPNLAFAVTGQQAYTTPGIYSWIAPAGVTSVSVVSVGGGAQGGDFDNDGSYYGGGGGGLSYANNVAVTPGYTYIVHVGNFNGDSYMTIIGVNYAYAGAAGGAGGFGGYSNKDALCGDVYCGSPSNTGGGYGGDGGYSSGTKVGRSGAGGAGGYAGKGGGGGGYGDAGASGAGGGGGGGGGYTSYGGRAGGGVGILGQGSDGAGGAYSFPGLGGSGGADGMFNLGYSNDGGLYGGGAGAGVPGTGAVRIIWPGTTRYFPSTNTADLTAFDITPSFGANGSIFPSGVTSVLQGGSQTFSITPSTGYSVSTVLVDGVNQGAIGSYTFSNVQATHTISATFSAGSYGVTWNSATGGTSSGAATCTYNTTVTPTCTPSPGYSTASCASFTCSTSNSFTPSFSANSYTYTFAGNGATTPASPASVYQNYLTAISAPSAPLRTGYTFTSWSPTIPPTMPVNGGTSNAQWSANSYGVIWNSATGGTSSGVATCTYGTTVTPTCTPSTGYSTASCAAFTCSASNSFTPSFSINSYTVTFDTNTGNGGATSPQSLVYNTPTALTTNGFTKTGYTFAGWNTAANGTGTSYANGASYTIGATGVTLYAKWTANSYTVTFDTNGGNGGATAPQSLTYNTPTALTTNGFTKTGYTFTGWNTQANGSGTAYANGASYTIGTAGVTLYAQWSANSYTITFDSAGGSAVTAITQAYTSTVIAPASPTKSGYTFSSWSPAIPATMGLSQTVTAQWSVNSYTVTFDTNGGGGGATGAQSLVYNTPTALTTNGFTRTDYSFSGWNTVADGSGTTYANGASYTIGTAGVTLYAQWTINPYISSGIFTSSVIDLGPTTNATTLSYSTTLNGQTITMDVRAGNTATPDGTWSAWQTDIADGGSLAALVSYRYVQYRANLSTSDTGVTPTLDSVTINTGYNTYTLTLPASGGTGSGTYSGTSAGAVNYGSEVTVTATPNTGSTFTTWTASGSASSCNGSAINPCTFAMTGVASVTANYSASTFTLTVVTGANGSASGPSGTYNYGQVVTLTATPNAGYYFAGWSGDVDCSDGSVTMTADVSCTANFTNAISQDPVTGASVSSLAANQATLSWTNPSSPGSTIMIVRSLSPITTSPINGTVYIVGSNIDAGTSVVYMGGIVSTFVDSGLTGGFSYYYKIFAKNLLYYSTGVSPTGSPVTVSGSVPIIDQIGYLWRNDDSSGSSAVSQNTALSSGVYVGDRRRLRFQITNGSAYAANSYNYRLEYSVANCTDWNPVPVQGTYTNQPWIMDVSPYISNGLSTSHYSGLSSQAGSFVSGLFNTLSDENTVISLPTNSYSELEYSLKSTSNSVPGSTYCFRLTNGGSTDSFTYSSIPQIILKGVTEKPVYGGGGFKEVPSAPSGAVNGGSGGGEPSSPIETPAPPAPPVQGGTPSGGGGNGGGDVGILYNGTNGLAAAGSASVRGILWLIKDIFSSLIHV